MEAKTIIGVFLFSAGLIATFALLNQDFKDTQDDKKTITKKIIETPISPNQQIDKILGVLIIENDRKISPSLLGNEKIKNLVQEYQSTYKDVSLSFATTMLKCIIVAMLFFIFTIKYLNYAVGYHATKSFILLTARAEKNKKVFENGKNKTQFYSVSGVVFALLTGVISSAIWAILT